MALVIFCVALVAALRTRMSLRLAISRSSSAPRADGSSSSREGLCVAVDRGLELRSGGVGEVAGLADVVENVGVLGAQQPEQALLEGAHPVDRDRVEIAVHAG